MFFLRNLERKKFYYCIQKLTNITKKKVKCYLNANFPKKEQNFYK